MSETTVIISRHTDRVNIIRGLYEKWLGRDSEAQDDFEHILTDIILAGQDCGLHITNLVRTAMNLASQKRQQMATKG